MGFIEDAAERFKIIDSMSDRRLADQYLEMKARCEGAKTESALDNLLLHHTRKIVIQRFLDKYGD